MVRSVDSELQNDPLDNTLLWSAQALRNKIRLKIFQLLSTRNSCSFNELINNLNISQPKLAYHLQKLVKFNIITNFYDKRQGVKDHSFYALSDFGRDLISRITISSQLSLTPNKNQKENREIPEFSNFRSIRHLEYKSYQNSTLKRSENTIEPVNNEGKEQFDNLLNCHIITKPSAVKSSQKINIPGFKKYYSSYKNPFITKQKTNKKGSKNLRIYNTRSSQ